MRQQIIDFLEKTKFKNRNAWTINNEQIKKQCINLEWWNKQMNIGDQLALTIYEWMLQRKNAIDKKRKTIHLMTLGSIIGMGKFDAVIWGSGVHCFSTMNEIAKNSRLIKYDIRAVRGPLTREFLKTVGYNISNCKIGDPAVLMPLIYPKNSGGRKKYRISIIHHISISDIKEAEYHIINVKTNDYKFFIDEIVASEWIISSSLHGIILAESYGIPAIFINENMDNELIKFYDWYYSTNRKNVKVATTIEEALKIGPMDLPLNISVLQADLLNAFPYDLYVADRIDATKFKFKR